MHACARPRVCVFSFACITHDSAPVYASRTDQLNFQWEKMEASNHLVEEDGYRIWVGLARGLHNADRYGKSDPYAIVKIGGREVFRTHVIDDSLDPCWNVSVLVPVSKVNHLMAQQKRREKAQEDVERMRDRVEEVEKKQKAEEEAASWGQLLSGGGWGGGNLPFEAVQTPPDQGEDAGGLGGGGDDGGADIGGGGGAWGFAEGGSDLPFEEGNFDVAGAGDRNHGNGGPEGAEGGSQEGEIDTGANAGEGAGEEGRSRRSVSFHRSTSDGGEDDEYADEGDDGTGNGSDHGEDGEGAGHDDEGDGGDGGGGERQSFSLLKGMAKKVKNLQHLKRMSSVEDAEEELVFDTLDIEVKVCQKLKFRTALPPRHRPATAPLTRRHRPITTSFHHVTTRSPHASFTSANRPTLGVRP